MSAYTPGPWKDCDKEIGGLANAIAMRNTRGCTLDEVHANARLLKSSPAMAEALRELLEAPARSVPRSKRTRAAEARARSILSTIEGK